MRLEPEERLRVGRRRQGLTQLDVAEEQHVSQTTVSFWERGIVEAPLDYAKRYRNLVPKEHELCNVLRLRLDITVRQAATALGVSHVTLLKAEQCPTPLTSDYLAWLKKQQRS